jgi:hypothetical protein
MRAVLLKMLEMAPWCCFLATCRVVVLSRHMPRGCGATRSPSVIRPLLRLHDRPGHARGPLQLRRCHQHRRAGYWLRASRGPYWVARTALPTASTPPGKWSAAVARRRVVSSTPFCGRRRRGCSTWGRLAATPSRVPSTTRGRLSVVATLRMSSPLVRSSGLRAAA